VPENHPLTVNEPLYAILSVPDKGKGLIARLNIAKGKRILSEKPLFTSLNLSPISLMESNVVTKLKKLSKTEQRQFLSLHNKFPGKHPFSGIVKTNALPCGSGSTIGGIYPTICLINHSCLSNAHQSWNSDTNSETIHAIRPIRSGEEITISYDAGGSYASRHTLLKAAFGFDCDCTLCSLSLPARQTSDARRLQIQRLDTAIGDPDRVMHKPDESMADCRRLLGLLEEEYYQGCATALIPRLYYDAFQISIMHGDRARAGVFAKRAYQYRVLCEGEDSPATRQAKGLMQDPAGHGSFGASMRWRTGRGGMPKGLNEAAFEEWLWRRGR
jgi:SET domain